MDPLAQVAHQRLDELRATAEHIRLEREATMANRLAITDRETAITEPALAVLPAAPCTGDCAAVEAA